MHKIKIQIEKKKAYSIRLSLNSENVRYNNALVAADSINIFSPYNLIDAASSVILHWIKIANGEVPFGYAISDD